MRRDLAPRGRCPFGPRVMTPHAWEKAQGRVTAEGFLPAIPGWACARCGLSVLTYREPTDPDFLKVMTRSYGMYEDCDEALAALVLQT